MWDAVMNYLFTRACIAFFIGESVDRVELAKTSFRVLDPTGAESFAGAIEHLHEMYHPNVTAVQMNLLDSHDMPRFLALARDDRSALRLATLFQMTYSGAPSIYYGDEIGLSGGHDPANRGAFPWHRPETWDTTQLHDIQRYIALRKSRPALRRGSFRTLLARDNVIAFARQLGEETVVVALNTATGTRRVDLPLEGLLSEGAGLDEVWTHETARVEGSKLRAIELAPRSGRVFATPLAR
jgi:neopullulanase